MTVYQPHNPYSYPPPAGAGTEQPPPRQRRGELIYGRRAFALVWMIFTLKASIIMVMLWTSWLSRTEDNSFAVMYMAMTVPVGYMLWGAIDAWIWPYGSPFDAAGCLGRLLCRFMIGGMIGVLIALTLTLIGEALGLGFNKFTVQ